MMRMVLALLAFSLSSASFGQTGPTGATGATGASGATGATGSTLYSPATPSNWPSPAPSDFAGALDYLAAGSVGIPRAASGTPPTCGASQAGRLYLTAGYTLCVCNGTNWVRRFGSNTSICSF